MVRIIQHRVSEMRKILFAVLIITLTSCSSASQQPPDEIPVPTNPPAQAAVEETEQAVPRFEPAECAFSPPFISYVDCGYLIVPENRDLPDSPMIRLHVAIAHSLGKDPEPDPLIYLSGGPGSFALEWLYGNIPNYTNIIKKRDVIFFDPRGVGFSEPSLDCPEVMEAFHETRAQPISDAEWADRQVAASLACRDRLVSEGIDLDAYHSAAMAADVNDLRAVLGYDQVNLLGISYGTRTAQTVMRDFPDILRSVVLDSVVPVEADLASAEAVNAERALQIIFKRCAGDTACNKAYPDLEGILDELTEAIEENPITIKVRHLVRDKEYEIYVNQRVLGWGLVESLYNFETAIYLPKLISDTQLGEDDGYHTLATALEIYLLYGDFSSEGQRYSVLCSDEGSFTSFDDVLENNQTIQPSIADYYNIDAEITYRVCEEWGAKAADPIENQPVISDIPTLILEGEYDPATPPSYGRLVAENLENAFFIEFRGLGHFVFAERRCPQDIVADFLDNPEIPPDNRCPDMTQFDFITY
jgi:pimeloyl-ACP methyl ester carboxylesterase